MSIFLKYSAYTIVTLRNAVQYRYSFIIYILGTAVQLGMLYCIWKAAFAGKSTISGFTEAQMMTYLFISQLLNSIYGYRNAPERMISDRIKTGDLALDLIKPVRFSQARFMENIGSSMVNIVQAITVLLVVIILFLSFLPPPGALYITAFAISAGLSFLILFELSLITGYFSFWTMNFWGLHHLKKALFDFLSGAMVPLSLFPKWAVTLSNWLPFKNIIYTPTMIYMGHYNAESVIMQLFLQVIWEVALCLLAESVYKLSIGRVQINGG